MDSCTFLNQRKVLLLMKLSIFLLGYLASPALGRCESIQAPSSKRIHAFSTSSMPQSFARGLGVSPSLAKVWSKGEDLAVVRQAHHFELNTVSDGFLLLGLLPALGLANLVALTGNLITLFTHHAQQQWGAAAIICGALTLLGGLPFFIEEGPVWVLIPLLPALAVITLGIINLVLGRPKPTHLPKTQKPSPRIQIIPWMRLDAHASLQGGMSLLGQF